MKKIYALLIGLFLSLTGFSQSCLPEGIEFSTQAQIDSFSVNYPNCTEIEGYVIITSGDITNLNGLSAVNSIGGHLAIIDNLYLTNLMGLNNLTTIGQEFYIYYNNALTSLTGLLNLTSIGGYLEISENGALSSLTGLENLTSIGGYLYIYNNATLNSLTGIENLTSIGGNLFITDNPTLTSLTGLQNIDGGSINDLIVANNSSLSNCELESICDYLASPNGTVDIFNNAEGCNNLPEVTNICGNSFFCLPYGNYHFSSQNEIDEFSTNYPICTELNGSVLISGDDITNLNGLSTLTYVSENLEISDNQVLSSLTGLENLTSIGGNLFIVSNPVLTSLTGLNNLKSIGIVIIIQNNNILTSLSGIDSVNAESITNLYIVYNPALSDCDVQSVCDYLASPNGAIGIESNAIGCNSQEEVEAACLIGVNDNAAPEPHITIHPSPSSTTITITLPSTTPFNNTTLSIYNVSAQQVISRRITEPITVLDIGTLPRDVYFARITTDRTVQVGKFVKQ